MCRSWTAGYDPLLLEVLCWRIVARVDRIRQEGFLLVGPELADVRIALDHGVGELAVLLFALADEHRADDIAEFVEMERSARRISQRYLMQRGRERLAVVTLATQLRQRRLHALAGDVHAGGIAARQHAVVLLH